MDKPSGKTQAIKQYGDQDWRETIRWLKLILRLIQRVCRGIEVTLYEMYPDAKVPDGQTETKGSGEEHEARNNADSDQDSVVQRDH